MEIFDKNFVKRQCSIIWFSERTNYTNRHSNLYKVVASIETHFLLNSANDWLSIWDLVWFQRYDIHYKGMIQLRCRFYLGHKSLLHLLNYSIVSIQTQGTLSFLPNYASRYDRFDREVSECLKFQTHKYRNCTKALISPTILSNIRFTYQ